MCANTVFVLVCSIHVVFGHVVSGHDLVRQLEQLPVDRNSRPLQDAVISNCGELVRQIKGKSISFKTKIRIILNQPTSIHFYRCYLVKKVKSRKSESESSSDSEEEDKKKKKKKKNKKKKKKKAKKGSE